MVEDVGAELDALIASYETRIAQMEKGLAALREARAALGDGSIPVSTGVGRIGGLEAIQPDSFVGLSIADASHKLLKMLGRPPLTTDQIADALTRGGLRKAAPASVATILIRIHNSDGPIVRVQKGLWGLAEWYPKRPPRAKRKGNGAD